MSVSFCDQVVAYELDEGVDFKDFVGKQNGATSLSTGIAIFRPSASLPLHIHSCEESVTVLEGRAFCDVAGQLIPLKPYDTSFVPARVPHRFINVSDAERLIILWVYPTSEVDRIIIEENSVDPVTRCKSRKYLSAELMKALPGA